jgi:homoserine kinase type II
MAVYTEVSDEALRAFLGQYALGELLAFRGIAEGVENSNFSVRTTAGDFILTLYEKRVDPAELPWFLGLMQHLAAQGLACPQPVAGRDGAALRSLAGRPAAICTFLPGVWPRRVRPAHCVPLGQALAGLHLAGAGYAGHAAQRPRPPRLGAAARWLPRRCRGRDGTGAGGRAGRGAGRHPARLALRAAGGAHPRRPVPGQRVLPGRSGRFAARLGPDRLLLRLHGPPGL